MLTFAVTGVVVPTRFEGDMLNEPSPTFLADLAEITDVSTADARYLEEPRGRYFGKACGVVKPRSTAEVASIIQLCNTHKVGVIPYGGGTGLVGGQVNSDGPLGLVLSLERMNAVRNIDPINNTITVESGVILQDLHQAADEVNRLFPLSLASEGSCRIGGNLATNAGGVNVLRYGNARELCLGIEAVLPDGSIFNGLKSLRKDNTGFDLRNLLIGSEGALGIITAATLKLFPKPIELATAFVDLPTPQVALQLLGIMQHQFGNTVSAFELVHRTGMDFLVESGLPFKEPFTDASEWMVLLEVGAGADSRVLERLENTLANAIDLGWITDAVIAQNEAQRMAFWQIRETIPEANRHIGSISSHDISVPVSQIPAFINDGIKVISAINPDFRLNCFGHLGDGNLHYNVFPPKAVSRNEFDGQASQIKTEIHDLVHRYNGSFSAEHGVGRVKKADMLKYGDPARLAAMRAIKAALDPNGIMNPGAVI